MAVPDDEQAAAIEAIAANFPGGKDLGATLSEMADENLEEDGIDLSFADDIVPALGNRVAIAGSIADETTYGALELDDSDRFAELFDELVANNPGEDPQSAEHSGVDYTFTDDPAGVLDANAFVDDHLLFATSTEALEDLIDSYQGEAESLVESSPELLAPLESIGGDEALVAGTALFDDALEAIAAREGVTPEQSDAVLEQYGFSLDEPIAFSLAAEAESIQLDVSFGRTEAAPPQGPGALFAQVPVDAIAAYGAADLGESFASSFGAAFDPTSPLGQAIGLDPAAARDAAREAEEELGFDPLEASRAIGDAAIFVRGASVDSLSGAFVAEVEDASAVAPVIEAGRRAAHDDPSVDLILGLPAGLPPSAKGFAFSTRDLPILVTVALTSDKLVLGFGDESARLGFDPGETIGLRRVDEAEAVLGEGFEPTLILDTQAILQVFESAAPLLQDPDYVQARPFLDALGLVVAGSMVEGDRGVGRLALSVIAREVG